jgi:deazaflavin-dependent oxidoreductase (nitroreductase family)
MLTMTTADAPAATLIDRIPYPSHPALKAAFKSPILLWRLGLGPVIGRLFMIMTTTGRVSGLPRRTAIEFHEIDGRPCVLANWPQSNWLRNLAADPILTVQTWRGAQVMRARELTDAERGAAYDAIRNSRLFGAAQAILGLSESREAFIAARDRFRLITFDPVDPATLPDPGAVPPPLEADLSWALPMIAAAVVIVVVLIGLSLRRLAR